MGTLPTVLKFISIATLDEALTDHLALFVLAIFLKKAGKILIYSFVTSLKLSNLFEELKHSSSKFNVSKAESLLKQHHSISSLVSSVICY